MDYFLLKAATASTLTLNINTHWINIVLEEVVNSWDSMCVLLLAFNQEKKRKKWWSQRKCMSILIVIAEDFITLYYNVL